MELDDRSYRAGSHPDVARRLAAMGGQYSPTIGTSTKEITDRERDATALADFEAALELVCFGTLAGREW